MRHRGRAQPGRAPVRDRAGRRPARAGRFTRDEQGSSAAVAALFREFDDIELVRVEPGFGVGLAARTPNAGATILLEVFDTITSAFVPPHVIQPDRQHERAVAEIGALDVSNPRDLARLLDATTSPDAAIRCLAAAKLELADPLLVAKPWTHSLEDSSRAVRRAAIRAAAHVARPDLRLLFERALADKDACVRYYALRGSPRSASAGPTRASSAASSTTTSGCGSRPRPPSPAASRCRPSGA